MTQRRDHATTINIWNKHWHSVDWTGLFSFSLSPWFCTAKSKDNFFSPIQDEPLSAKDFDSRC